MTKIADLQQAARFAWDRVLRAEMRVEDAKTENRNARLALAEAMEEASAAYREVATAQGLWQQ